MNKKIFTWIGITIVVLFFVGGYFFWKLSGKTQEISDASQTTTNTDVVSEQQTNTTPPTTEVIKISESGKILVPTKNGDNFSVSVNNFFNSPQTVIYEEMGATLRVHPFYTLLFFTDNQSFLISLSGGDLYAIRTEAENDLITILGVTKEDACKLKVSTTVPSNVNKKASGKEYGLSFCLDGKPLPKNLNAPLY